jgi:hypothetical protein
MVKTLEDWIIRSQGLNTLSYAQYIKIAVQRLNVNGGLNYSSNSQDIVYSHRKLCSYCSGKRAFHSDRFKPIRMKRRYQGVSSTSIIRVQHWALQSLRRTSSSWQSLDLNRMSMRFNIGEVYVKA